MVLTLSCPCCGAPLEISSKECSYCRTPMIIRGDQVRKRIPVTTLEDEDDEDEDEDYDDVDDE